MFLIVIERKFTNSFLTKLEKFSIFKYNKTEKA